MQSSPGGEPYDTIIIGCGMAGLAAGIRLALFDKRVLILEKHNAPGGLNSFYFQAGRKFDVGLHAVTNCSRPEVKGTPLAKLLRQLRIPRGALDLSPQVGSRIAFPGMDLRFTNDFDTLEADVAEAFPGQIDGFRKLRETVLSFNALDLDAERVSAREMVQRHLSDPVLEDMLFCPLMYYGSAWEYDMDFDQYVTLWRALFEEGFGRPLQGVRVIIRALLDKYRSLGGERRMRCGVRRILHENGRAVGVETETGEVLPAHRIISTAGRAETEVLCGRSPTDEAVQAVVGRLSFAESISVLSSQPADMGLDETIVFFNDSERFHYEQARKPIDLRSGVICFPNNYQYPDEGQLPEGLMRVTALANYETWTSYAENDYQAAKEAWFGRMIESAVRFLRLSSRDRSSRRPSPPTCLRPGPSRNSPPSRRGGVRIDAEGPHRETDYENLYLAGTDQGFLGIIGAMLSGISMANRHALAP
jgi:phytoene dehydrogenase-like protein